MSELDHLRRQAAAAAGPLDGGSPASVAGLDDGFQAAGPVRLHPLTGESAVRHGGYLAGRLLGWMAASRRVDDGLVPSACAYAAALATPEGQRMVPEPGQPREPGPGAASVIKAHLFAAALAERHRGERLQIDAERTFFAWLLEATGTLATPELRAKVDELRERRLERTGR
jgi:hypothetical protein